MAENVAPDAPSSRSRVGQGRPPVMSENGDVSTGLALADRWCPTKKRVAEHADDCPQRKGRCASQAAWGQGREQGSVGQGRGRNATSHRHAPTPGATSRRPTSRRHVFEGSCLERRDRAGKPWTKRIAPSCPTWLPVQFSLKSNAVVVLPPSGCLRKRRRHSGQRSNRIC